MAGSMSEPPRHRPMVSAVIACYNEAGNVREMHRRLTAVLAGLPVRYELLFVENGSTDATSSLLNELAGVDPHVKVIVLSRNFGSQSAFSCGLEYARGDCAVLLDGDLQDPPELLPQLIERWQSGYDVVYGERAQRDAPWFLRLGYKAFYRLFSRMSYVHMPVDAGDFGLIDRRVIDVLNAMPENRRFLRGLRAWAGFRQCGVPYRRAARYSGRSSNSLFALFRWASDGIVSFSYAPLQLISLLAAVVIVLTGIALLVYLIVYFVRPGAPSGFETILVAVLFLGSVQLLCLSILGMYVARIFEEVKRRPRYLVDRVVGGEVTGERGKGGEDGSVAGPGVGPVGELTMEPSRGRDRA